MPTMYDYVYAKCPYFLGSKKTKITCEGIAEGCVTSLEFSTEDKKKLHRKIFCNNKYQNCEICRMLDEKNEEE